MRKRRAIEGKRCQKFPARSLSLSLSLSLLIIYKFILKYFYMQSPAVSIPRLIDISPLSFRLSHSSRCSLWLSLAFSELVPHSVHSTSTLSRRLRCPAPSFAPINTEIAHPLPEPHPAYLRIRTSVTPDIIHPLLDLPIFPSRRRTDAPPLPAATADPQQCSDVSSIVTKRGAINPLSCFPWRCSGRKEADNDFQAREVADAPRQSFVLEEMVSASADRLTLPPCLACPRILSLSLSLSLSIFLSSFL